MGRKWAVIRHAAPSVILGAAAVAIVAMLFGMDPGPAAAVAGLAVATVSLLNALRSWRLTAPSTGVKVLHIAQATAMSAFAAATVLTVAVDERWLPAMMAAALLGGAILLADLVMLQRDVKTAQARHEAMLARFDEWAATGRVVDKTGHGDPAP